MINIHPSLIPSFCGKGFYGLKVHDKEIIKETLINPVEAREAKLEKPQTIHQNYPMPDLPEVLDGFNDLDEAGLKKFIEKYGLAMDLADIEFLQNYFKNEEKRDPRITEVRVIDTYWSDHCRHTTFNTIIEDAYIKPEYIKETYENYLELRKKLYINRPDKKITLMDLGTIGAKALKASGKLKDMDGEWFLLPRGRSGLQTSVLLCRSLLYPGAKCDAAGGVCAH